MRGRDKLLEDVSGEPLLRVMAKRAISCSDRVFITLPLEVSKRRDAISGLDLAIVDVASPVLGMSESLRCGIEAANACDAVMILPADMPDITAEDMTLLWRAAASGDRQSIIRATSATGKPGHPVIFRQNHFDELAQLQGDSGAKAVVERNGFVPVALANAHALTDLDTPEDWDNWRQRQNRPS
jgi:CTP:molybdopterin cytidylyltransferase MocA